MTIILLAFAAGFVGVTLGWGAIKVGKILSNDHQLVKQLVQIENQRIAAAQAQANAKQG